VVLRLLRGEPLDAVSREVSVPIYKLERWHERALAGIDAGLKERDNDPVERELDAARRRIGELVMEVEVLQNERRAKHPLAGRRAVRRFAGVPCFAHAHPASSQLPLSCQ
jgi:hypothetical protein